MSAIVPPVDQDKPWVPGKKPPRPDISRDSEDTVDLKKNQYEDLPGLKDNTLSTTISSIPGNRVSWGPTTPEEKRKYPRPDSDPVAEVDSPLDKRKRPYQYPNQAQLPESTSTPDLSKSKKKKKPKYNNNKSSGGNGGTLKSSSSTPDLQDQPQTMKVQPSPSAQRRTHNYSAANNIPTGQNTASSYYMRKYGKRGANYT